MSSPSPSPSVPFASCPSSQNSRDSEHPPLLSPRSNSIQWQRNDDDPYPSSYTMLGLLHQRQFDAGRHPPSKAWFRMRRMAQCVVPNMTVADVKRRFIFPRRFSSDGRFLIALNSSQVLVYEFRGLGKLTGAIHNYMDEPKPNITRMSNNINCNLSGASTSNHIGNDYWVKASSLSAVTSTNSKFVHFYDLSL